MIVALLALFVALSGTAVAAGVVPLAKRALTADNAKKLNGFTATQIATVGALAGAKLPSPASTAAGLIDIHAGTFSLPAGSPTTSPNATFSVACAAGERPSTAAITPARTFKEQTARSAPTVPAGAS
jgi:hypothetical protein